MTEPISYKRHRFLPQIIAHAVWLYFRIPLSLWLFEEMLLEREIVVSDETIRRWGKKFVPSRTRRSDLSTHFHRLTAMVERKGAPNLTA